MLADSHPKPADLRAFVLGMLTEELQVSIEEHVLNCPECGKALEQVPDDTMVCGLRAEGTIVLGADNEHVRVPRELVDHPRYRIVRTIGRGGMGIVLKAEHKVMQRMVALKVINPSLMREPHVVERFHVEVRAAAQLDHPNIVRAHDADQAGDAHFLVMEFVEGASLDDLVRKRGPLSVKRTCQIILQAAKGLEHAWQRGMVHRDIKPQNLMLTRDGVVKVLDFGLARFGREVPPQPTTPVPTSRGSDTMAGGRLTAVGAILGTPDYIAPEQALDSHNADIRADVYSLGCTSYFLLTGRPPFPKGTAVEKVLAHADATPQSISDVRDGLPADLVVIVERMLAKEPAERFQSPSELISALTSFLKPSAASKGKGPVVAPPQAQPAVPSDKVARPRRRRRAPPRRGPWLAVGIALLLTIAGGLVWLLTWLGSDKPNSAPAPNAGAARNPKVLFVIPHRDFYNQDVGPARRVLEDAGVRVEIASSAMSPATSWKGETTINPDLLLKDANVDDYTAVIFTGQVNSSTEYAEGAPHGKEASRIVRDMLSRKKYVASICTGAHVLAGAGVLRGKRIAVSQWLPVDFATHYSATKVDQPVVVAGQIITGRDPEDSAAFARELVRRLDLSQGSSDN